MLPGGAARRSSQPRLLTVRVARRLLLLLLVLSAAAQADGSQSGLRLYDADSRTAVYAPQLDTAVTIAVSGMLLRATVVQRFTNPGTSWAEGIYTFPLPADAAVDRLRLRYAGRLIEGEVQERQTARRHYEQARAAGQGATLLDQQRDNVFTTSVANIPPGETVEVTVVYQQHARWRGHAYSLRFPMVVAPRYIPGQALPDETQGTASGWSPNTDQVPDAAAITPPVVAAAPPDVNPLSIRVELDVGLPLAAIDSPYHAVSVDNPAPGRYTVELVDVTTPAERDFELRWRPRLGHVPSAALFSQVWRERHYGLLMLMPPRAQVEVPAIARELILVVDTSGSMHGESIEQARAALQRALSALRPADRFNIVQFNDRVHSLFAAAVPADATHLRRARDYVAGLSAEGGTEMLPAMRHALRRVEGNGLLRQIVFLTDGAIGNEQALFELIAQRIGDSRLFTVGIGSAPNALFMRKAARFGRGSFAYIGASDEVEQKMARLFRRLRAPVLTDLRLTWQTADGRPVAGQAPQRVPDLYADEPLVVAVQSAAALRSVRVEGRLAGEPWAHTIAVHSGGDADSVHVLWARRSIDDHIADLSLARDAESVRADVLAIALEHRLVSRYTSLVAVDRTPQRPMHAGLTGSALATRLPAGWSATAVFGRLPKTATPAPLLLLVAVAGLGVAWLARPKR